MRIDTCLFASNLLSQKIAWILETNNSLCCMRCEEEKRLQLKWKRTKYLKNPIICKGSIWMHLTFPSCLKCFHCSWCARINILWSSLCQKDVSNSIHLLICVIQRKIVAILLRKKKILSLPLSASLTLQLVVSMRWYGIHLLLLRTPFQSYFIVWQASVNAHLHVFHLPLLPIWQTTEKKRTLFTRGPNTSSKQMNFSTIFLVVVNVYKLQSREWCVSVCLFCVFWPLHPLPFSLWSAQMMNIEKKMETVCPKCILADTKTVNGDIKNNVFCR